MKQKISKIKDNTHVKGFTGGDWKVSSSTTGDEYSCVILGGQYNGIIARTERNVYVDTDEAESNAILISQAPAMYENLKRIIDRIEESDLQGYFPSAYLRAKDVLKKANP